MLEIKNLVAGYNNVPILKNLNISANSGDITVVIGPNGSFEGEIISNLLIVSGSIKGKFNIKNLHIRKDGTLSGKAKYLIVTIDSGGKVLGELGLTKAPRAATASTNKSNNNKNSNSNTSNNSSNENN